MPNDKERNSIVFDDYFNSVFKPSNTFSKEEFSKAGIFFDLNYGKYLPKDKTSPILDLGSGAGHFLYYLTRNGYTNFEGIDISRSQVEYCRENISKNATCADAFEFLPKKENTYEYIVCNDVLEHIPKDKVIQFLKLVHAALKPSGTFIVKCPNAGNPFSLNLRYKDFTHECAYDETSLSQVLYLGGFRNMTITAALYSLSFPKNIIAGPIIALLHLALKKLFWWQGYVAPQILSPVLIGIARKDLKAA